MGDKICVMIVLENMKFSRVLIEKRSSDKLFCVSAIEVFVIKTAIFLGQKNLSSKLKTLNELLYIANIITITLRREPYWIIGENSFDYYVI